jgi:hypothetical protein
MSKVIHSPIATGITPTKDICTLFTISRQALPFSARSVYLLHHYPLHALSSALRIKYQHHTVLLVLGDGEIARKLANGRIQHKKSLLVATNIAEPDEHKMENSKQISKKEHKKPSNNACPALPCPALPCPALPSFPCTLQAKASMYLVSPTPVDQPTQSINQPPNSIRCAV